MAKPKRSGNAGAVRCAVYTRKSTEEGLEQVFNTLHAQREACEAYVLSQRHEGWSVIPTPYDDGGFSGGSMERPALQQLLADIRSGVIDVVVVYKVDRLTRSLSDFAKIVEIFDVQGVSFVSVTQAFNTTTSMGRLTLNVLLSFAQFEREVTAERIRDKMAASKRKDMWMGGFVPFGYDAVDKKLVINEREANDVRTIFDLYLKLGNVRLVKAEADKLGIHSKRRNVKNERRQGGGPLWRSHIYWLLTNPLYLGNIRYRGEIYDGEHDAIVDLEIWELVQARLIDNGKRTRGRTSARYVNLLAGLLFTEEGAAFTSSHAKTQGKRYRYYIERPRDAGTALSSDSRLWRIPAHDIEAAVPRAIANHLRDRNAVCELVDSDDATASMLPEHLNRAAALAVALESGMPQDRLSLIQAIVTRVTIHDTAIIVALRRDGLVGQLTGKVMAPDDDRESLEITVPVSFRRRGVEMKLVLESTDPQQQRAPDPGLVQLVARAYNWFSRIANGDALGPADLAAQDQAARTDVSRALPLAFLAPDILRAILEGRHPPELTPSILVRSAPRLPSDWNSQRQMLGFPQI